MTEQAERLDEIIGRFTDSERSLRALMESAQELKSAAGQLSEARSELDQSRVDSVARLEELRAQLVGTCDVAERSFGDASSNIYGLTAELRDISRDLRDMAITWRSIGPGELKSSVDELAAGIRRRENQMRIWLSTITVLVIALGALAVFR